MMRGQCQSIKPWQMHSEPPFMIGCWRVTIKLSPDLLISAPSMSSPSHSDALLEAKHRLERFKAHQRQRSSDRFHCRQNVVQILDQDENLSLLSNSWSAPSALGGAVATASSAAAPSSVPLSSSLPSDGGAQYLNQHNDDPRYNGEQNKPSTRSSIVDAEALPSPPLPLPLPPVLLTSSSSSPSPVLSTSLSAPAATSIATHAQGLPAHEEHRRRHHCRPRDGPTRRIFTRFRGAAGLARGMRSTMRSIPCVTVGRQVVCGSTLVPRGGLILVVSETKTF